MTNSKYGDLIRKARETDSQEVSEPDNQITSRPVEQTEGDPENQNAIKQENQLAVKPDNQNEREREVNLCVKVPESLRRHWAAESKRHGITMTEVIIQALKERFGSPN
ncbi:hypothetical protein Cri9333_4798 (plasmid) [Crinalium epipsammum PCC 9333]|uniref:Uncharacterized protein n=1 Tax=Crinalium epipsammum PCC 9333 TaxID=1173022 RepID=K9W5G1_9CYAN|nr:hypothetical protein [Crinalium epipsammum]AFZ15568.1 hypothetical protein Cri9333_4798 [Crinalium epipsammum PCC 9333]